MSHKTEVIEYKKLSDGQFAVLVRCCGDEKHDSWHTVGAEVLADEKKLAASLEAHHTRVANSHRIAIAGESFLKKQVGKKKRHD